MRRKSISLIACGSLAVTLCGAGVAWAEWLVQPVTPRSAAILDRTFRVTFKNAGENTACEIAVIRREGSRDSLRHWSRGTLYRNPRGRAVTELPQERSSPISMIEKWGGQAVTYHIELPRKRLSELRFEFWDSATDSPDVVGGGTIYWFNLRDFQSH
jgi:hypothetical protein